MRYWLLKTEPDTFSFQQLLERDSEPWDGVRNYQARNFLAQMSPGDLCIIYHSGEERAAVGIAKVISTPYPDPTTEDTRWVCVDVAPVRPIPKFSLSDMKAHPGLSALPMLKQSRLSVMPITMEEFQIITEKQTREA
jgi:predicted RNA-binding protein with PUA-like domain